MRILLLALLLLTARVPGCSAASFTAKAYILKVFDSSLTMQQADQAWRQAENAYKNAVADALLPSMTLTMSHSFYDEDETSPHVARADVRSALSASLNLYDSATGPNYKLKTARQDRDYARLTYLITKQAEAVKALNRFYALYSAQGKTVIARMNLESRQRQYRDTDEQYQSGTRSRIEVTQSEGDKLSSELSLAQAEAAERKALMAFNELLDVEPESAQEVAVSTQAPDIKLPLSKEDIAKALAGNLALRRTRISLERTRLASQAGIRTAYPRLKLDAAWSKADYALLRRPWNDSQSYGVVGSLSFPFGFAGTQNRRDVDTQRSVLLSAELSLKDAERTLKTSVLTAQKDIELQVKSRQLLDFQVKAQKDATDNLLTEYSMGGTSFLQLDSSQTKLLDASNSQISAVNDLDLALADYRVLLGENIWE